MKKRIAPLLLFFSFLLSACFSSESTEQLTSDSPSQESTAENAAGEPTAENTSSTTDNMNDWIDVQGIKIRRSPTNESELAGKKYVRYENYNSGGGSGGYNSERRMNLCSGNTVTTYENSQTSMYVEGMDGSSASEDSDSGTWEVYEDKDGNLFLKLSLKKGGEGYVNFTIKDGKMYMGELVFSITTGDC